MTSDADTQKSAKPKRIRGTAHFEHEFWHVPSAPGEDIELEALARICGIFEGMESAHTRQRMLDYLNARYGMWRNP